MKKSRAFSPTRPRFEPSCARSDFDLPLHKDSYAGLSKPTSSGNRVVLMHGYVNPLMQRSVNEDAESKAPDHVRRDCQLVSFDVIRQVPKAASRWRESSTLTATSRSWILPAGNPTRGRVSPLCLVRAGRRRVEMRGPRASSPSIVRPLILAFMPSSTSQWALKVMPAGTKPTTVETCRLTSRLRGVLAVILRRID